MERERERDREESVLQGVIVGLAVHMRPAHPLLVLFAPHQDAPLLDEVAPPTHEPTDPRTTDSPPHHELHDHINGATLSLFSLSIFVSVFFLSLAL